MSYRVLTNIRMRARISIVYIVSHSLTRSCKHTFDRENLWENNNKTPKTENLLSSVSVVGTQYTTTEQ